MEGIADIMQKLPKGTNKRITYEYNEKKAKFNWLAIAQQYIHGVRIAKDTKHVWNQLLKYAMNDSNCELDTMKGIALMGQTGSGKSITFDILNDVLRNNNIKYTKGVLEASFKFQTISARRLSAKYSEGGHGEISKYSEYNIICIDDLGAENTQSKYYGDTLSVIEEIIENRYSNNLITHFSTNLKMDEIKEVYGDRVHSRISESFNILKLSDSDYRITENK